jgi:hypothetical protein
MNAEKIAKLLTLVHQAADDYSKSTLKFQGDAPFKGFTPEQRKGIEDGLKFYCRAGATAALHALTLHGEVR